MRVAHCRGEAGLLAAGDEVVEEHAQALSRTGAERAHLGFEVIGAVEALHDDALDAQVVAPDLLDEFGVVHAFHPDAAAARDARLRSDDRAAARRGATTLGHTRAGVVPG